MQVDLNRVLAALADGDGFDCPYCNQRYDLSDGDVSQHVVSFWGEEPHDFSCDHCGGDFVVKEVVTRRFNVAKTAADLDAI